jgi:hypothetical protein
MFPRRAISTFRSYCDTAARASFHRPIPFRIFLTTRLPRHARFQTLSPPIPIRTALTDSRHRIQSPQAAVEFIARLSAVPVNPLKQRLPTHVGTADKLLSVC